MRSLLALLLAASAGACASVLPDPAPAPRIFPLRAALEPAAGQPGAGVLAVAPPTMSAAHSGADIVWARDGEIAYMERSVWASRAPDALQALLIETIDRQDLAAAAVMSGSGVRADGEIRWSVVDFHIVEEGADLVARFRADAKLMDPRSRRIIAALSVDETEPLAERSAARAAGALALCAQRAARTIGAWAAAQAPMLMASPEVPQADPPASEDQPKAASITR